MAGGHYVALSGMRTRLDELDRLASDLANVGTAGYKAERTGHRNVPRPVFDDALESAIDSCLLYTSPSPRDRTRSRMPSSA